MHDLVNVSSGRPVKFTPERLDQIRNLVERGMGREQIASTIGVTVGSLQVTCSRLGISLRRRAPPMNSPKPTNGPPKETIEASEPMDSNTFSLVIRRGNQEVRRSLILPQDVITHIVLEGAVNNESIPETICRLLMKAVKR